MQFLFFALVFLISRGPQIIVEATEKLSLLVEPEVFASPRTIFTVMVNTPSISQDRSNEELFHLNLDYSNPDSFVAIAERRSFGLIRYQNEGVLSVLIDTDIAQNCDAGIISTLSKAEALQKENIDLSSFQHVLYMIPDGSNCDFLGLGEAGGTQSWYTGDGGIDYLAIFHELGHNYGNHHGIRYDPIKGAKGHVDYTNIMATGWTTIQWWRLNLYQGKTVTVREEDLHNNGGDGSVTVTITSFSRFDLTSDNIYAVELIPSTKIGKLEESSIYLSFIPNDGEQNSGWAFYGQLFHDNIVAVHFTREPIIRDTPFQIAQLQDGQVYELEDRIRISVVGVDLNVMQATVSVEFFTGTNSPTGTESRAKLANGAGCWTVQDRDLCCNSVDGRDGGGYENQKCIAAVDTFPSGNICEPESEVERQGIEFDDTLADKLVCFPPTAYPTPLPEGREKLLGFPCHMITDREHCCRSRDGRDFGIYENQNCYAAVTTFSNGNICEPKMQVEKMNVQYSELVCSDDYTVATKTPSFPVIDGRQKLTGGAGCYTIVDRAACCKSIDGRDGSIYANQDCYAAVTTFPSGNVCEPENETTNVPDDRLFECTAVQPTNQPSAMPSPLETHQPTSQPTARPTNQPTARPTNQPTARPTNQPTARPTNQPVQPTNQPSAMPSPLETHQPTSQPTARPTNQPTARPTSQPTARPTNRPSSVEGTAAPSKWTCPVENYGAFDGCHCECGDNDPDCDFKVQVQPISNCNAGKVKKCKKNKCVYKKTKAPVGEVDCSTFVTKKDCKKLGKKQCKFKKNKETKLKECISK